MKAVGRFDFWMPAGSTVTTSWTLRCSPPDCPLFWVLHLAFLWPPRRQWERLKCKHLILAIQVKVKWGCVFRDPVIIGSSLWRRTVVLAECGASRERQRDSGLRARGFSSCLQENCDCYWWNCEVPFLRLGFSAEQLIKHHRRRDSTALLQSCNYAARYLLTAHLYLNVELKAIRRLY